MMAGDIAEVPPELLSLRIRLHREDDLNPGESLQRRLDELEAELIREALERTGGNKSRAALQLGVSRQGLHKKLVRLGLGGNGPKSVDEGRISAERDMTFRLPQVEFFERSGVQPDVSWGRGLEGA